MSVTDPTLAKRFLASAESGTHAARVQAAINKAQAYAGQTPKPADLLNDAASLYTLRNQDSVTAGAKAGPNGLQAIAEDDIGGACDLPLSDNGQGAAFIQIKPNVRLEFSKDLALPAGKTTCDLFRLDGGDNFTICAKPGAAAFASQRSSVGTNQRHPEWTVGKCAVRMQGQNPGVGADGKPRGVNLRFHNLGPNLSNPPTNFRVQGFYILVDGDCSGTGVKQDQSLITPRGKLLANTPKNGVWIDIDVDYAYSGYGLFQNSALYRCAILNIREWGGTVDRNESDGHTGGTPVDANYGLVEYDHVAIYQEDGNKTLTFQPNKANYMRSWYVDGIYGIGNLETANSGQFDGGYAGDADQTFKRCFFGEIWGMTGDHSTWQEQFPCHTNDTAGTWVGAGPLAGNIWGSIKYNLGKRGGPGAGQDGTGAAINFASRDAAGKVNGTLDSTMTPATMRARWASKKVTLGVTNPNPTPGKPVLTGPTGPVDEPFPLTVHGTVDLTSSWEWRLTKDASVGAWQAGASGVVKDVQRYGCQLGIRALDQATPPSPLTPDPYPTVKWIDWLEDNVLGRNCDFRNCYLNVTTTSNFDNYFNDTYHGQTPRTNGSGMEWGAWWRGEIAYIQIHGRRSQPGGSQSSFTNAIAGDDCFWDRTAPNIPATDPQWPTGPKGVTQGDFDTLFRAMLTKVKNTVYPTNAFTTALGVAGQPVRFYLCFHHEPVNDFAVQGYADRSTAGPGWARAFNHLVSAVFNAAPMNGLGAGFLGYIANLTNGTFDGSTTTNPADWQGNLNFAAYPSGDAYVKSSAAEMSFDALTAGQFAWAQSQGEPNFHGELGFATGSTGSTTMTQWLTALGTTLDDRRQTLGVCWQGNAQTTQPYFEEIVNDTPGGTQSAFQDLVASETFVGLSVGTYKLEARCTNANGTGPVSNAFTIRVNGTGATNPPLIGVIDSGPVSVSTASTAVFTYSSSGATSLQYSLDGGAFITHASPLTITSVTPGTHNLVVHGTNTDGVGPNSAAYTWTVVAAQQVAALNLVGTSITDKIGTWAADADTLLPIAIPPNVAVNDLLLLWVGWSGVTDISLPSGWTLVERVHTSATVTGMLASRVATGTEGSDVIVTGPNTSGCSGLIINLSKTYALGAVLTHNSANSG